MKYFNNRRSLILSLLLVALVAVSCVFLDGIEYEDTLNANEQATFTMNVRVKPNEDSSGQKLIISILVPNSWEAETNTTVTYTSTVDDGVERMSIVPLSVLPLSGGGLTWPQHLKNTFGAGPNVLSDMKWITFQSDNTYSVANNEEISAVVTIKTLVGPKNLKAKLGFFVNNSGDGLGTDDRRWKVMYSDCIEVINGTGATIDFCELHYNVAQPLTATKNDFVTFKFQGDIQPNQLVNANAVYFCSTAYTNNGGVYQVCGSAATSAMQRESQLNNTYTITIWPADYYDIPEGEEIAYIDYSFRNADGSVEIKESDGSLFKYLFDCN